VGFTFQCGVNVSKHGFASVRAGQEFLVEN
jgi:hypothetical protein